MRPRGGRLSRRLARMVRWAARVLVACTVLLTVLGGAAAPAAAAVAILVDAPACACPHGDDDGEKKACPCCAQEDGDGHCLPVGPGCAGPAALAPPVLDSLIPLPPLAGIAAPPEVELLDGRTTALRLERPPRA